MRIDALLATLDDADISVPPEVLGPFEITSVVHDTRQVTPGALFCCVAGSQVDGHDLVAQAVEAGAVAVLAERPVVPRVPTMFVPSVRQAMGPIADAFWQHPSRHVAVAGVTGTSGKTTTTHLLGAIGRVAGWDPLVIGTLSGPRTTPEAPELQAVLAEAVGDGRRLVAMEVSSHALALGRVRATRFAVAVFTNLSHDHLDFHRDLDDYFEAKAQLFTPDYAAEAVVNLDDPRGAELARRAAVPTRGYALTDVDDLTVEPGRVSFRWRGTAIEVPMGGRFNASNALAAATAADVLGVPVDVIASGLASSPPVPGRFEAIEEGQPFTVLVDYSHKPGALASALGAAREASGGGRVVLVFGAGGERDASKRPEMGEVASRLADRVLLTSDNPRGEDPLAIIDAVRSGMADTSRLTIEPDRAVAIELALSEARPGDVVVIAGKGHESVQVVGGEARPFDDRAVARELLRVGRGRGAW
jgi:UDP-N-acetylmuramoyl-L-alanyl-D-glutamate--2,6-diaminopimelate ligase